MENQEQKNEALIGGSGLNAGLGAWISIDDHLPSDDCKCLVVQAWQSMDGKPYIEIEWYRAGSKTFQTNVTHWIRLPEAPNVK